MKKRILGHKTNVNTNDRSSIIAVHCHDEGHIFDFDNFEIFDTEKNLYIRKLSEMIHIHNSENTSNKKTDLNKLSDKLF